jgi:hypothetical protein
MVEATTVATISGGESGVYFLGGEGSEGDKGTESQSDGITV